MQLSPEGFAAEFKAASRALWCVAAAVLGGRGHADDVLQEAALIALEKLDTFDPTTAFAAWMGQIVRFVALNHARRRTQARVVTMDPTVVDQVTPGSPPPPGGPLLTGRGQLAGDQTCFDDHVLAALRGLGETPRACLLMRVVADMPYREIARTLDIPEGTAMSHVHRARRDLLEKLSAQPSVPTGGTNA